MACIGTLAMAVWKHECQPQRRKTLYSIGLKCTLLMETLVYEFVRHPVTFATETSETKAGGKIWTLQIAVCLNGLLAQFSNQRVRTSVEFSVSRKIGTKMRF